MGKKKSDVSSKNRGERRKTFLCAEGIPTRSKVSKKSVNYNKKESENEFDVDSLEDLRDVARKKKSNGIDEKIKLLKTELKTLFSDRLLDKNFDCSTDTIYNSRSSDSLNLHNLNQVKSVAFGSDCKGSEKGNENFNHVEIKRKNFIPVFSSTPFKPLEHLNTTFNKKIFLQTVEQKLCDKNLSLNSNSQMDITQEFEPPASETEPNICSMSSFSQERVEQLLYKSFVKQNSVLNLSPKERVSDQEQFIVKTKKKKCYPPKLSKCNKKKSTQNNLTEYYGLSQGKRQRRTTATNSSQSDVEIVNIDSTSCSNLDIKNDLICLDSDIKDYDWNEPFDLDNTECQSDLEIIETCEKENTNANQGLKLNNTNDLTETDLIACNNNDGKVQLTRVWECPVCFENFKGQEVVATQCGHIFCKKCLENHFSKLNQSCPSCRSKLTSNKPFITLFNF